MSAEGVRSALEESWLNKFLRTSLGILFLLQREELFCHPGLGVWVNFGTGSWRGG